MMPDKAGPRRISGAAPSGVSESRVCTDVGCGTAGQSCRTLGSVKFGGRIDQQALHKIEQFRRWRQEKVAKIVQCGEKLS